MEDPAKVEQEHREKIASEAQVPVSEVTPSGAESALNLVGEAADVGMNHMEGVASDLFAIGSSVETVDNKKAGLVNMVKAKIATHLKPDEEIKERTSK